ncbi:MAG: MlrC C-terminal domain-containing protein, partial [Gammaproteobacteria bacterium]
EAVHDAVERLAESVWRAREGFVPRVEPCKAAIDSALANPRRPVILVDVADNVGGGSPGDGTEILQRLLTARAHSGAIVIWDPGAAAAAVAIGAGGKFSGSVGGKSDARHGPPVVIEGAIQFADRVVYKRSSSYMTGLPVDLGHVAVVDVGGLEVMLTEQRAMPFDADHLRAAGISPRSQQLLVVKSAIGWKAAFADVAGDHVYVDTPGACASDLRRLRYTQGANRLYPLDPNALYPGEPGSVAQG